MKKAMVYSDRIVSRSELKMKFTLLLLLIGVFMGKANYDYSPNAIISLDLSEVTLLEVFNEIEDKTKFTFFYKNDGINLDRKVTIKIIRKSVPAILARLFENNDLVYEINGKQIIVKKNQEAQINGIVIDKATGEPIPYCNIAVESLFTGTASNELGEFVLDVDALPTKLVFSHLNYEKQQLEISGTSDLIIELVPLINILDEVVVADSKRDRYAFELARKAFKKADQNSNKRKHGRAFYRQKSKNGDAYSEFSEIIYDLQYTSRGIGDWEILEGRYALNPGGVHNKNYTLLSRLLTPLQPDTDDLIFPMHDDFESFYTVRIIEYISSGDDKIAVLWFKPKKSLQIPIFDAEVYVNTTSHELLKIVGSITHDNLKLVKLTEKNSSWKDYSISYEIAYRQDSVLKSVIDYVKIDQEFDYYKNDSLEFHTASTSNLTFFEHYTPTSRKKLGGQFRKNKSDWQKLDEIGYNERFWEDNPIVKRTPVEEEVIASFEKDEAFGSIFLNSRNQLAVMQSNLKGDLFVLELGNNVNQYNNYNPVEKVYLHTDKDLFSAGEDVWYSSYVVLGSYHHFSSGSKVLYLDLIGPENKIILSQTNEIIGGKCYGSLKLPENLPSGNYQIRSYTDWMRNFESDFFFTRTIEVVNEGNKPLVSSNMEDKIDLQFFPEGGYSVDGLISVVAFKAIGSDGLERKIQGRIVDSQGKFVATLGTMARGSGFFSYKPGAGGQYTAILKDGTKYNLPEIMDEGYAMTVNNVNPKSIQVKIQATPLLRKKPFYIVGHLNNKKYYQGKFEFEDQETASFEFPKNGIPSGVLALTLFDQDRKPWCERVVFVNNQDELVISAKIDQKKFERRDKVDIDVHVTDTYGRPVSAELSLAVTDKGQLIKNQDSGNILTHLLLQSNVKGHVSNPGLLFKDQRRATMHSLDLVMLTHGWRKFPWQEIEKSSNIPKEFPFSKGLNISGIAESLSGMPLANLSLNVIAKSQENLEMFSANTSHEGKFLIPDFNFRDSTQIVFNALNKGNKPIDVQVKLDSNKIILPLPKFKGPQTVKETKAAKEYSDFSATRKNMRLIYDYQNTTELEEVVITEKITKNAMPSSPSLYGQNPDAILYAEENKSAHTVLNLVSMFGGVTVSGNVVSIRNRGTPLWILNGVPVYNENISTKLVGLGAERQEIEEGGGQIDRAALMAAMIRPDPVPLVIQNMDTYTIERIEIIKGASAAIYGSRGGNGVILIYTKRGGSETLDPVLSPSFSIFGHAATREFYSPKYDVNFEGQDVPDYRATLYWNPSFTTDRNGNASLIFYNSDNAKQLQVAIEGLSEYGTPGAYLNTFGQEN
jgi:TonB-dependent SusC/RagA subfamily outer membrane receptor